eukprot:m.332364 g.332364  ORF g.332364 m.332364 type:complete len:55 (+) comp16939_c0_seq1:676-840(+)
MVLLAAKAVDTPAAARTNKVAREYMLELCMQVGRDLKMGVEEGERNSCDIQRFN